MLEQWDERMVAETVKELERSLRGMEAVLRTRHESLAKLNWHKVSSGELAVAALRATVIPTSGTSYLQGKPSTLELLTQSVQGRELTDLRTKLQHATETASAGGPVSEGGGGPAATVAVRPTVRACESAAAAAHRVSERAKRGHRIPAHPRCLACQLVVGFVQHPLEVLHLTPAVWGAFLALCPWPPDPGTREKDSEKKPATSDL